MKKRYSVTLEEENVEKLKKLGFENLSGWIDEALLAHIRYAAAQEIWYQCDCGLIWTLFAWRRNDWICPSCKKKNIQYIMKPVYKKEGEE